MTSSPSLSDLDGAGHTIADADLTLAADSVLATSTGSARSASVGATDGQSPRTTVLPRVELVSGEVRLVHEGRLRYETSRVLGEGGMGTVDLARDHDIDRLVAIKRLRPEVAGPQGVARFTEEVRTVAQLEHPNIVPVHDVGLDSKGYFLVMKFVEGETLEGVIERLAAGDAEAHARYNFEVRVQIMISLLRALAYAHDRGIIHRDIKPANIMIGPYGEVVLMDWGVARPVRGAELPAVGAEDAEAARAEPSDAPGDPKSARQRLVRTQRAGLIGTPLYMSPEQAAGATDLDARSDLYSACAVFHELLTTHHYLEGTTSVPAVLVGILDGPLPSFSGPFEATQGPPPMEYLHFVRRGMAKDRAERWSSAGEMVHALEAALSGCIQVQCPTTMTKRMTRELSRFVDRHPSFAASGFIGLVALALAGAIGGILSLVIG